VARKSLLGHILFSIAALQRWLEHALLELIVNLRAVSV
jgi:hypothetical protein